MVTLVVDEEFLTDEDTVYPVIIDPSVATNDDHPTTFLGKSYFKNFSTGHSYTESLSSNFYVGYNSDTGYDAITYLMFSGISTFAHINPANIEAATLSLDILSSIPNNQTLTLNSYNFAGAPFYENWNYDNAKNYATKVNPGDRSDILHREFNISDNTVQLNITEEFYQWLTSHTKYYTKDYTLHYEDGLILTSSTNRESRLAIASSSYFTTSSRPSVSVTYTESEQYELKTGYYRIQSGYYNQTARYLTADNGSFMLYDLDEENTNQLWYVKHLKDYGSEYAGRYVMFCMGSSYMGANGRNNVSIASHGTASVPVDNTEMQFFIPDQMNGYRRIVSCYNKAIAASGYGKENGTPIVQETVSGLDSQRWKFHLIDAGVYSESDTYVSGLVGDTLRIDYVTIPWDTSVTFTIGPDEHPVEDNVARIIAHDNFTAYIEAKAPGTTSVTATIYTHNPITNNLDSYSYTWYLTVASLLLSHSSVNLKVGETKDIDAQISNAKLTWSSSDTTVATVDQNGKITAVRAGSATIVAKACVCKTTTCNGSCDNIKGTCEVNVKQKLTGYDTLITHEKTKEKLINYKTLIDENDKAFLKGNISSEDRDTIKNQLELMCDVVRADYISVGNNTHSAYAYNLLGGDPYAQNEACPLSHNLALGSEGIEVIILQRVLELLGYYEHPDGENYGVLNDETLEAACAYPNLMTPLANGSYVFSKTSYNILLGEQTIDQRTYDAYNSINQYRVVHDYVAKHFSMKVGGTWKREDNKIIKGARSGRDGYADVLKITGNQGYLWEVKPDDEKYTAFGGNAHQQINRYLYASELYEQPFDATLEAGYSFNSFSLPFLNGMCVNVRNFTCYDERNALILYKLSEDGPKYDLETEVVPVEVPEISFEVEYDLGFIDTASSLVIESINIMDDDVVLGCVCVMGTVTLMCFMSLAVVGCFA